jgi:DnaK suppressor protein
MVRKDALMRPIARLMVRRDALRKTLTGDLESLLDISQANGVGDDVDAAIECEHDEIFSRLVEIESRELAQIERALERIAEGNYGRCEYCGGKIPAARLEALPYSTSCIHCQRANERAGSFAARSDDSNEWAKLSDASIDADEDEGMTIAKLSGLESEYREPTRRLSRSVLA